MANTRIPQLTPQIGADGLEYLEIAREVTPGVWVSRRLQTQYVAALALTDTGVTPGTYGSENQVGQFTVDAEGRITAAANVAINNIPIANTTGILNADRGGTGFSSYTVGDLLYASGAAALSTVGIGAPGEVLAVNLAGTGYEFIAVSGTGTVTAVSVVSANGFAGSVANPTTTPAITITTTLGVGEIPVVGVGGAIQAAPLTGTGSVVLSNSPTLVTPDLGTPSAANLSNATGLPIDGGTTGTLPPTRGGTGLAAYAAGDLIYASAINVLGVIAAGANTNVLTMVAGVPAWAAAPSSGLTVGTTSIASGTDTRVLFNNAGVLGEYAISGTGSVAMTTSPVFTTPSIGAASGISLNLSGLTASSAVATDGAKNLVSVTNTGTGNNVLATSPTLTTPVLGVATATSINGLTITASTGTLTIANGKTLTASNTITLAGTDGTTMTFPATSSNVLTTGNTAVITKGYTVTPANLGTVSSGTVTLAGADGQTQYYTNNGAHTLAAPAADTEIDVLITNGASAGAITFSGFTVGSVTGSALTTTNGHRFLVSVRRINGVSTYSIYALQ